MMKLSFRDASFFKLNFASFAKLGHICTTSVVVVLQIVATQVTRQKTTPYLASFKPQVFCNETETITIK